MITRQKYRLWKIAHFGQAIYLDQLIEKLVFFLYRTIFFIMKLFLKKKFPEISSIWMRNSMQLNYAEPFVSDVDFTIWIETVPSSVDSRKELQEYIFIWRKFFPFVGEAHLICGKQQLEILKRLMNPYELRRDPVLCKLMGVSSPFSLENFSDEERLVFLVKMMQSNFHDLRNYPKLRSRKWNFHFKECQLKATEDSQSFERALLDWIVHYDPTLSPELMQKVFDDNSSMELEKASRTSSSLYCLYVNRLCYFMIDAELNRRQQMILWSVVKWEICGLLVSLEVEYTQELSVHIDRLRKVALQFMGEHEFRFSIESEFENLKKFVEPVRKI